MIDFERFCNAMAAIGKRCASTPDSEQLAMYHEYLNPLLTTGEFLDAAKGVWVSSVFFPPPAAFLISRSRGEWRQLTTLLGEFTPPNVPEGWHQRWMKLSEATRQAVTMNGGPLAFKEQQLDRNVAQAKALFMKDYGDALEDLADSVPIESTSEPEQISGDDDVGLPLGWEGVEIAE